MPEVTATTERTTRVYVSKSGTHLVVVERWLDRQMSPPRWRSKNRTRRLSNADIAYLREHQGGPEALGRQLERTSNAG